MLNAIPLDPDLPRQRRSVRSGLFYSALSIAVALFVLGKLPAVDALLASLDATLRAHDRQIVSTLFHLIPFGFVAIASFGLVYKLLGVFSKTGRSL